MQFFYNMIGVEHIYIFESYSGPFNDDKQADASLTSLT